MYLGGVSDLVVSCNGKKLGTFSVGQKNFDERRWLPQGIDGFSAICKLIVTNITVGAP